MELLIVVAFAYLYLVTQNARRRTVTDLAMIIAALAFALGLLVGGSLLR